MIMDIPPYEESVRRGLIPAELVEAQLLLLLLSGNIQQDTHRWWDVWDLLLSLHREGSGKTVFMKSQSLHIQVSTVKNNRSRAPP